MSDLAKQLREPAATRRRTRCRVAVILAQLDESDPEAGEALREILARTIDDMPSTEIRDRLGAADLPVSVKILQTHRRGDCACPS